MANGKANDNPLSDLTIHGINRFPEDIRDLLMRIDRLGRGLHRWPLGENWPYSLKEFDWVDGVGLDEGRKVLQHFVDMLEIGRGDEVMVDSLTGKPFVSPK